MPIATKDLKEFPPVSDKNEQMLQVLRVRKYCKENELITRIPVISISGHVDSGKSTTLALVLAEHDVIDRTEIENLQKEAQQKAQSEGQTYDDQMVNVAKIVEKGKEAKNRGVTIETQVHRLRMKNVLTLKNDSKEHKEAMEILDSLDEKYECDVAGADVNIKYTMPIDLIDCPGHKDYVHNSATGIGNSDVQLLLFPSNAAEDDEQFIKMIQPETSLSLAHARLGTAAGKQIVICLSKAESNPSKIKDRCDMIKEAVRKKIPMRKERIGIIPTSNMKMKPHNIVTHSDIPELKEFNEVKFNIFIRDYRDYDKKTEIPATLTNAFDALRYMYPSVCYQTKMMLSVNSVATKTGHGSVLVCVVINGAVPLGQTLTSTKHGEKLTITSMEQFRKPVEVSATGAHIGIKVKNENKKFDLKLLSAGDLLYAEYPEDNVPICSEYLRCKIAYMKKTPKHIKRKIGNSSLLILGSRHTISIVHVYSKSEGKVETKHTDAEPITTWDNGEGCVIDCLVRFARPSCIPTISQTGMQSTGGVLEHHSQVGSLKSIQQIPQEDGEKLDQVLQEARRKAEKKASNQGKKKKK